MKRFCVPSYLIGLFLLGATHLAHALPATGTEQGPPECLDSVTVQVNLTPAQIMLGQSSRLSWSVNVPQPCPVHFQLNGAPVAKTGTTTVTAARAKTFTVAAVVSLPNQHGATSASATLRVLYPQVVVVDPSTPDPVDTVIGALTQSTNCTAATDTCRQVVELCAVDLDFTGLYGIVIDHNRSLIASPECARGPRSLGPRIFVRDIRPDSTPLFRVRDSNVLFSGFRLEGPTSGIGDDDNNRETGISIDPFSLPGPLHDVEISNMEVFHWSGEGILVEDNADTEFRGRLTNQNVSGVHIVGNYLHHNRHYSGYGYGVDVADGAYALIERNVFEENRHAIAGGSGNKKGDWSGYTAQDNLILPGGGLHCSAVWCWQTHQVDMHGDVDTTFGGEACCGTAGETIIIQRNTILYTGGFLPGTSAGINGQPIWASGLAIKIRGNPVDKAVVDGNVFAHKSREDAIAQNGSGGIIGDNITNPIHVLGNNVYGANPLGTLGSCDFFGDGMEDQFMATGVTWWAKSPVTQQWRYLNTMSGTLPQLELRKVDADAVCDVVLKGSSAGLFSKSGTGPWMQSQ